MPFHLFRYDSDYDSIPEHDKHAKNDTLMKASCLLLFSNSNTKPTRIFTDPIELLDFDAVVEIIGNVGTI